MDASVSQDVSLVVEGLVPTSAVSPRKEVSVLIITQEFHTSNLMNGNRHYGRQDLLA